MSTSLLSFALAAMSHVSPLADHHELASAIVDVVESEPPLFANDADRRRTVALVSAVAFREGSLGLHVEGDLRNGKPTSWCTAQINLSPGAKTLEGWTGPELRDDPVKCITVELRMLRESIRICPKAPVAFYAAGPGWKGARAIRISNDRVALAKRMHAAATAALAKEDES